MSHTPGPWSVRDWADKNKGYIAVIGPGAEHICDVFPFGERAKGVPLAEHADNARLIAAAPDILTVLAKARTALLHSEPWSSAELLINEIDAITARVMGRNGRG